MKNKIDSVGIADLQRGFSYDSEAKRYMCLFCDKKFEEGDIYAFGKRLVDASKAVSLHIAEKHGTVFENLISLDKSLTGLTDTQKEFLKNAYSGIRDKEIAEKMNISPSTVRYQRYNFREKVKQAKLTLALYALLEENKEDEDAAAIVSESEKMLESLFVSVSPLKLKTFDFKKGKDKKRLFILETIIKEFEKGRRYTEKEVNAKLMEIYGDYAILRRSLIDYGFMKRTDDGKEYWL